LALCFVAALIGQVVAVRALGAGVGMPLTQLNLVVSGAWGIFAFGEIDARAAPALAALFGLAAAVAVSGSVLLLLPGR